MALTDAKQLLTDTRTEQKRCFRRGVWNNLTDITLTTISVLSSLAATVVIAVTPNKAVAASIAAIPAACTALQRTAEFRGRSHWYFQHATNLMAFCFSLESAENHNLEEFGKRRAQIEIDDEPLWAQIGTRKDAENGESKAR